MSTRLVRTVGVSLSLLIVAAACGDSDSGKDSTSASSSPANDIDYESIGLWDDGPCDPAKPPLKLGLMVVFESPVISLKPQADALEAAAVAFNDRGGANGSCIEVTTCDDGANVDQSLQCVRTIEEAGVVATISDQTTAGAADVSTAMAAAGIPRLASNVTPDDFADPNAFPTDGSGTGFTFMLPEALRLQDLTKIGLVRVDLAAASAMKDFLSSIHADNGIEFVTDTPVPAGTTDYSQFILAAEDAGAQGVALAIGDQEVAQVVKAGQQLDTELEIGTSPGPLPHPKLLELGDFAERLVFLSPFPPATLDLPVYKALRADLAASGEEALQPATVTISPMRSWIGLYALLRMIRDAGLTDFTRENITAMLKSAQDVPMHGIFGDEDWTPDADHPGAWKRVGTNHWGVYRFDPDADAPDGLQGNFVETGEMNFDEVMCGSAFGGPC